MPKGIPKKPGEEQTLEGGGAGSGRMTVAERWAKRSDPNFDWGSLKGPKIPKEIKEERAARFKAERENLINFMNTIPKSLSEMTEAQKATMTPGQLSRREQANKNFAELMDRKNARKNTQPAPETPDETSVGGADGMKKGGMTASRRADGIASRGKTKGRIV